MTDEAKTIAAWEKTKELGFLRFVLKYGLLMWGLPMLIFMGFINDPFAGGLFSRAGIVHLTVWPLAGLVFGATMWWIGEKKYQKALKSSSRFR